MLFLNGIFSFALGLAVTAIVTFFKEKSGKRLKMIEEKCLMISLFCLVNIPSAFFSAILYGFVVSLGLEYFFGYKPADRWEFIKVMYYISYVCLTVFATYKVFNED